MYSGSVVANDDVFAVHDEVRSVDLGFSLSWSGDVM